MEAFIEIEFVNGEPSKIRVKASNGYYSGFTEDYINANWLIAMMEELKGFPKKTDSTVTFESEPGKKEDANLYFKFYCKDDFGHTGIRVCMKEGIYASSSEDEARFIINYEAAALDNFIKSLSHVINNGHGTATLQGVINNA